MDEKQDIVGKVRDYTSLVKQSKFPMQIEQVYLFGSYAKGNPDADSDIDVALVVRDWVGDYFDVIPLIWRLTEKVDMRIEPHVIVPQEDYAGFLDEIRKTGILICVYP
jgi:predicted nucleotidyltransferase